MQGRMSGRGRCRPLQERVPGRLLAASRHVARSARAGQRLVARHVGQPFRAAVELDRWKRPGARSQRDAAWRRSPTPAAAVQAADSSVLVPAATGNRTRCCSTTPSRTTTTRRSGSPRWRDAAGRGSHRPRAESAAAGGRRFQRACSERRARWPSEIPRRCTPTPRPAGRSCSASRVACRPCARTPRRCCAARAVARRSRSRPSACSSKSSPHARGTPSR